MNDSNEICILVSRRLKSVKSIQKITKSMKMVSAAKYAKAERELRAARSYGMGAKGKRTIFHLRHEEARRQAKLLFLYWKFIFSFLRQFGSRKSRRSTKESSHRFDFRSRSLRSSQFVDRQVDSNPVRGPQREYWEHKARCHRWQSSNRFSSSL